MVVLLGLIELGTLRRLAPLIERAEASLAAASPPPPGALPTGEKVPPFTAKTVAGAVFSELELRGTTTVLVFLGARCTACERLISDLERGRAPRFDARLVVVSESAAEARRLARSTHVTVLVDDDRAVANALQSETVPHAFVVHDGTVLGSGRPGDWEGLDSLVGSAVKGGDHQREIAAEALPSR